jgi:hypothetical protein
MRLRPHHVLCVRFLTIEPPDRGEEFGQLCRRVRELMTSDMDTVIEVTEGVDDLCAPCPNLGEGRCISPFGSENEVRKWDGRVLDGLGLSYGLRLTTGALREVIREKAPLGFCRDRCPWRTICGVNTGDRGRSVPIT